MESKNSINFEDLYHINESESFIAYEQYKNAMSKRRPESVLPIGNFINHVLRNSDCIAYSNKGKVDYVFGNYSSGIFHPSHFAPATSRGGYEIIKKLKEFDNVLFSVTDDLSPMLEKLGYYNINKQIPMIFNNDIVKKDVLVSSLELKTNIESSLIEFLKDNKLETLENMLDLQSKLENTFYNKKKNQEFLDNWYEEQERLNGKKNISPLREISKPNIQNYSNPYSNYDHYDLYGEDYENEYEGENYEKEYREDDYQYEGYEEDNSCNNYKEKNNLEEVLIK